MKPLAIDLCCGLGGWTEGLLLEGYDVVGFDVTRHVYGVHAYPSTLVIQDIRTLHGAQFKDVALIVASPPCQAYSWRSMPWKAAREAPPPDNSLFEACFRIRDEASKAAARHIPIVVENVKGAQRWVGRARGRFGSFYLWGDVPALMPVSAATKNGGGSWFRVSHNKVPFHRGDDLRHTPHMTNPAEHRRDPMVATSGMSRKAASALIAKIPLELSRYIAKTYRDAVPS
jgi:hypothetical protein